MILIPLRLKVLAGTGILTGALGAAALNGAFAAPAPDVASAPVAAPTVTVTPAASPRPKSGAPGAHIQRGDRFVAPVAGFLGISSTDLQNDLRNGQTLAQIAQAHGKSTNDLKTFLANQLKSRLDQAVANGRITSQQETDMLNRESARLDQLINTNFQQVAADRRAHAQALQLRGMFMPTIAQTLGMSQADVRSELRNGKTLAQIAQEHGKTAADLENAIITSLKPRLDQLMNANFQQIAGQAGARGQNRGSTTQTPPPTPANP